MEPATAQELIEMSCVMIPLQETNLLLPNICVAEILPWRRVSSIEDAPKWCLGMLEWRGEVIPVVRFERMGDASVEDAEEGRCLIVMNRSRTIEGLPFYALAAEGLPRIVQLTAEDMANVPTNLGVSETMALRVGSEPAIIPNLQYLEVQVANLVRGQETAKQA
ncbi:MAG TPA: chemotaxis protein CheW [Pseudomonadales bacterium]|jgi:chemosensory pili system protein ChpC